MDQITLIFIIGLFTVVALNILLFVINRNLYKYTLILVTVILLVLWSSLGLDLTVTEMGLSNPLKGVIAGVVISLLLALSIYILTKIPFTKKFFIDSRTKKLSNKSLAFRLLVDIPIGTVLMEEFIFRGILYGYLEINYSYLYAIIISSLFFGLWHILPALTFNKSNGNSNSLTTIIFVTVIFTAISGVLFAILRHLTGSIYAPVILHYAVNSSSLVASWYNRHEE